MKTNKIIEYYKSITHLTDEEWSYLEHPDTRPIPDATELKGGKEFLRQLYNQQHKVITIMPDYDADGITSGIYAYYGLKVLNIGRNVHIYFPNADDGFGISPTSVQKALHLFPDTDVLLTTDNGISGVDGVNEANQLGVDVMITDHHEGEKIEPNALAIVNPNRIGDTYPFKGLSGAHVIHKVLWNYMQNVCPEKEEALRALWPLLAISTVADVMPIRNENHTLVKQALRLMNRNDFTTHMASITERFPELTGYSYGIVALFQALEASKKAYRPFSENTFGWVIGPLLNTPRRLTNRPDEAFQLFLQTDWKSAYQQAMKLIEFNEQRKGVVQSSIEQLEESASFHSFVKNPGAKSFQTEAGHGVVGIIAGRLTNTYKVPVIVFSEPDADGYIQGSGRSPEGVHLLNIVHQVHEKIPAIFKSYGGHGSACGITIESSAWPIFEEYFHLYGIEALKNQPAPEVEAIPVTFPDPLIQPLGKQPITIEDKMDTQVFMDALTKLSEIAPFGHGFPPLQGVITIDRNSVDLKTMGAKKNHLKISMPFVPFEIIIWSDATRITESSAAFISIIFSFDINEWNGRTTLQGIGKDYILHDTVLQPIA